MTVNLQHDRWSVSNSDFAVRVMVPDLKGFFGNLPLIGGAPKGRSLVIEPGTRALVIDEGVLVGEVPAGSYTMESFVERLQFWRNKQTTIFLTRCEEVPIDSYLGGVPCLDSVCFDVSYRWTIQVSDIVSFMHNLMGARDVLTLQELEQLLTPVMSQSLYGAIGRSSFDEVRKPDFVGKLAEQLRESAGLKIQRYGLVFIDLQSAEFGCDDGGLAERKGELWLQARETQLQRAATQVESDQLSAKLDDIRSKVPVRKTLRDAVISDQLNKIQSREDFEKALADIDKGKLLRKEEREALISAYEERKGDRQNLREHLLATIDIQREQELGELRVDLDYAVQMRSLEKELDLSRLSRTQDNETWQHEIQREKDQASHRHEQKLGSVKAAMERAREVRRQSRDDKWEAVLQEQKLEDVRGDLELTRAERKSRIVIMQSELNARLQSEKLEMQKRQQEWDLELKQKQSGSQLDRLQRVQEMNAQFAERQHRMQVEMENLKADSSSKRELDRIQVMSSLSTEALIATAGTSNATLLADLKKHEASQEAAKVQATVNPTAQLNEERLRMYERMNETERTKADAIAEAYKMAMQAQHSSVNQMIGGLSHAATPVAAVPIQPWGAPPPMSVAEVWYVSLNGQQSPPLHFAQVQQYVQSGQVTAATMVWKNGLPAWAPAGQMPQLAPLFGATSPTPPPMPPGPPPM
jgi:hypothetical protein